MAANLDLDQAETAQPRERRLPFAFAKRHGILIVINTDAHRTDGLAAMRYGILQARRAGLTKQDVANTRPWQEMQKRIGQLQSG